MITFIDEALRHFPSGRCCRGGCGGPCCSVPQPRPAGGSKVSTVVIGMPHRGRLNLLTGPLQYPVEALLHKVPPGGRGGGGYCLILSPYFDSDFHSGS